MLVDWFVAALLNLMLNLHNQNHLLLVYGVSASQSSVCRRCYEVIMLLRRRNQITMVHSYDYLLYK